tara:strand:- start:10221 stop:10658 length:438 start_codon:yes stop_codon:yes gene_type:complete
MSTIDFKLTLIGKSEEYIKLITDYEKYTEYLPDQIKSVKVLEKSSDYTITEETLHLSSIISKTFVQQTKHYSIFENILKSEILSGPAKGSIIKLKVNEIEEKTTIFLEIQIKLEFRYKILLPIIKKSYRIFFTGILYKMQNSLIT